MWHVFIIHVCGWQFPGTKDSIVSKTKHKHSWSLDLTDKTGKEIMTK